MQQQLRLRDKLSRPVEPAPETPADLGPTVATTTAAKIHELAVSRSRRFRCAAAVHPGSSLLDLVGRHRLRSHEVEQNGGAARDAATAMQPAPNASRSDVEPPSDAALCDVKRVEYLAEFNRGSRQVARFHVNGHNVRLMMRST